MFKVIILAVILLVFAVLGISIKMLFDKKAEFKGSSCSVSSPELEEKGIGCGCGGHCETDA